MRYANETKVGLTVIVAVAIFIFGMRYFKDLPLFGGTVELHTVFQDASGLLPGNVVRISGVSVGRVEEVHLDPETGRVRVTFLVDGKIAVPEGSYAFVQGLAALGNVNLSVALGPNTNPPVGDGAFIPGRENEGLFGDLEELGAEAPRLFNTLEEVLVGADRTLQETSVLLRTLQAETGPTLQAIRSTAGTVDRLVVSEEERITRLLQNFEAASSDFARASANLERLSGSLAGVTEENEDTLRAAVQNLNAALRRLNQTLTAADTLAARLTGSDGSLGLLLSDPSLYHELDSTAANLNQLLIDFRRNPGRYLRELQLIDVF